MAIRRGRRISNNLNALKELNKEELNAVEFIDFTISQHDHKVYSNINENFVKTK